MCENATCGQMKRNHWMHRRFDLEVELLSHTEKSYKKRSRSWRQTSWNLETHGINWVGKREFLFLGSHERYRRERERKRESDFRAQIFGVWWEKSQKRAIRLLTRRGNSGFRLFPSSETVVMLLAVQVISLPPSISFRSSSLSLCACIFFVRYLLFRSDPISFGLFMFL